MITHTIKAFSIQKMAIGNVHTGAYLITTQYHRQLKRKTSQQKQNERSGRGRKEYIKKKQSEIKTNTVPNLVVPYSNTCHALTIQCIVILIVRMTYRNASVILIAMQLSIDKARLSCNNPNFVINHRQKKL